MQAPLWPLRTTDMGTNLVAMPDTREVVRCSRPICLLTQYRRKDGLCAKCRYPLEEKRFAPVAAGPVLVAEVAPPEPQGIQVARAVKDLRRINNLSQRELAARMGVPRTYISKIENEKAVPTLGSLERLAAALSVHISALLKDESERASEQATTLLADPFLAELIPFIRQMDTAKRSFFLHQARQLAMSRRRTA